LLRIIGTIGIIQVLATLMNFGKAKAVALLLGPEGVGVIGLVDQAIQTVSYVSALSLPFVAVKFLSRAHSQGAEAFQRGYAGFLRLLLAASTTGSAIALVVLIVRPEALGPEVARYRAYLIPALLTVPVASLHGLLTNVCAAAGLARAAATFLLVVAAALALAATVGTLANGIAGLYWLNLVTCALVAVGAIVYLRRRVGLRFFGPMDSPPRLLRENPGIVALSIAMYASTATYSTGYLIIRYSVLTTAGESDLGLLQAAIAVSGTLMFVLSPTNGLFLTPILNREIPRVEKLRAALEFQSKLLIALSVLALPLTLFPECILTLLYSSDFTAVGHILWVFVLAQCLMQVAGVYQALLIGLDDLKFYAGLMVVVNLALGGLAWLLAPLYGLLGVGFAVLGSSILLFGFAIARLRYQHGCPLSARTFGLVLSIMVVMAGVGFEVQQMGESLTSVVTRLGFYVLFVASLAVLGARRETGMLLASAATWLPRSGPRVGLKEPFLHRDETEDRNRHGYTPSVLLADERTRIASRKGTGRP
jgi:O-antigen/teichoic acid export membrane protein